MVVGERGQVTIPKKMRDKYGLTPGVEVEFVDEAGGVKVCKRSTDTDRFARFRGYLKHRRVIGDVDEYLKASRGR